MDNKVIKELKKDKLKAKSCNDIKELIKICNCLGKKYLQTQRYDDSIDEHKQELQYSLQIGCKLSEAVARRAIGECYSELNEYHKALAEHKKYLSLAQSLGDQIEIQRAFATIGRTYLTRAQILQSNNEINKKVLFEAKNSFTKALELCDNLTQLKAKELAEMRSRLYLNLGLIFEILGQFQDSMTRIHLSIALNKRFNLTEDLYRSQSTLAALYEKNQDLQKASNTYMEALKTAKTLNNKIIVCEALIDNGMVLMRLQKFEESRKQFKKAYKLRSPAVEDHQKVERLFKISSIICDQFRELSNTNDLEEKIKLCDKLGDHFVELKLFDISIDYYKKQLNYSLQCDKSNAEIAKIYVSIAETYACDMKYEEAVQYFKHELNCNRGNVLEETQSLIRIADMKECLKREELDNEIIDIYETLLRIANLDKSIEINILDRYLTFIENRGIQSDKVSQLKERLKILNSHKTTEIEMVIDEDEPDIYDTYDLNDISDYSTDSDEEMPARTRTKRMGKTLKKNEVGETPLHRACIEGKLKQVERLLADNHPINVRDFCGWTPLHEAVNHGHTHIVEILLLKGANINDNEGAPDRVTPLHDACANGHFDIIRLLLKNGAKVTLLNDFNETALESLQDWRRNCSQKNVLSENERKECQRIEKELQDALEKEGFVRQNIPILKSLRPKTKAHVPVLRRRDSSPEGSDDSLDIPINSSRNNRQNQSKGSKFRDKSDKDLDFDDPKVARREYCSSISNLRRNNDLKVGKDNSREMAKHKPATIRALLDEANVNNDQWLINDLNDTKKRSCLDAYHAFNKRTKTSESNTSQRTRKPKEKPIQSNSNNEMENESGSISSDSVDDIQICQPIADNSEGNTKTFSKNIERNINSRTYVKSIQLRVSVGDSENTLLIIPILNKSANCLWLNKEVEKRYFAKFGVKPVICLKTTDGALLSDEDCILDVINSDELKVIAKIESWVLEPLDERYKEICNSCGVQPLTDIVKELQITQINGCLKFSDVNLPIEQIKPIFRSLQRQNNLKEIDISCSNIIFEDTTDFLNCLPLLPSLQVLNLKCTALGLQTMEQLVTKSCPNLVDLNLSFNSFGDYFSEIIVKVIKHFPKLNAIDLSACDLTQDLLDSIEFNDSIKNSNLRTVVLDHNCIDSDLIQRFRKL